MWRLNKMSLGILGKKLGMTRVFNEEGNFVPVTVVEAGPCPILQVKTKDKDGYVAIQVGFEVKRENLTTKSLLGHFKKSNAKPQRFIKEFRLDNVDQYKVGQQILADIFAPGDCVDVIATSIGKGFQGGVKRWHWAGGPESHGSMHHRAVGSIGASSDPSRTYKGQHLPGRMGNARVTVQNLEIIKVDKENNLLVIKGALPGFDGCLVTVRKAKKKAKFLPKVKPVVKKKKEAAKEKKPAAKPAGKK